VKKLLEKLGKLENNYIYLLFFIKMKKKLKKIYLQQKKRALKKIVGTIERPRLAIYRSHKHIYAQLINDTTGTTIAFSSTLDKELKGKIGNTATTEASLIVGESIGERAVGKNVTTVVFDRGTRPYHGRVKSVAEGARNKGLVF
jgi:large subunit ribosomal protein L18